MPLNAGNYNTRHETASRTVWDDKKRKENDRTTAVRWKAAENQGRDSIIFTETVTGEKLNVKVEKLHRFDSFGELYKSLPLLKCGYTEKTVTEAKPSDMEEYYSAEEQKRYGVVGIEISQPKRITDETVVLMSRTKE